MTTRNEASLIILNSYFALLSPLNPLNIIFASFTVLYIVLRPGSRYKYVILADMLFLPLMYVFSTILSVIMAGVITILYVVLKYKIGEAHVSLEDFSARILAYVVVLLMLLNKIDDIGNFIRALNLWSLTNIYYYIHITLYIVFVIYLVSYDVLDNILMLGRARLVLAFTTTIMSMFLLSYVAYVCGNRVAALKTLDLSRYLLFASSVLLLLYHRLRVRSKTF